MRIPRIYKRIGNYFLGCFFTLLCSIGAFAFLTKEDNTLNDYQHARNVVVNKGITAIKAARGKIDAFFIEIKDVEAKVIFSKPSENYADLINTIGIGDTVNVYFEKSFKEDYFKIFHLEKDKTISINLNTYNRNNKIAGILSLIGAIFMISYTIFQDKKYWK